jgi:hypothetical protein
MFTSMSLRFGELEHMNYEVSRVKQTVEDRAPVSPVAPIRSTFWRIMVVLISMLKCCLSQQII